MRFTKPWVIAALFAACTNAEHLLVHEDDFKDGYVVSSAAEVGFYESTKKAMKDL